MQRRDQTAEECLIEIVTRHAGQIPVAYWLHLSAEHLGVLHGWNLAGLWEYSASLRSGCLTPRGVQEFLAQK